MSESEGRNFAQVLLAHAEQTPDRVAIHLVQNKLADLPITYSQLVHNSSAYAQRLMEAGVRAGDVVVLILQHGESLLYAFWGAVLHGAVPSILPWLTDKLSPEKYRHDLVALIEITQPAAIVTYAEFASEVDQAVAQASLMPRVLTVTGSNSTLKSNAAPPYFQTFSGLQRHADDLALLQHSSGSTGLQKGVALSHQAVFNQLASYAGAIQLSASDVICSWLPLYHDMGFIAAFVMPVLMGVPLVLMSPFEWVRAPARLLLLITQYGGTLCWLPNFAFNFMAQKIRERDLAGIQLNSMRAFINCSEPTYAASHALFAQKFAPYGLQAGTLTTCYAMAENVFAVAQSGFDQATRVETRQGAALLSAGKPLPNVRVQILDEQRQTVSDGQIGEIAIQSNCMLTGYFHREDLTTATLHEGWFLTGDLGYLSEGELFVTGRKKDLIIVGGKNVYPQDLERLASDVPGVHPGRVVAFGVPNEASGTEDVIVVAETDIADEDERYRVSDAVRQSITQNSDVAVRVVKLVEPMWLLKTSSGKLARGANREKYLAETQAASTT